MRIIDLKPLMKMGRAAAEVAEGGVSITVSGINGCMKAWLTGEENLELGNIVNGKLTRSADTKKYDGILITSSGRHLFYAPLRDDAAPPDKTEKEKEEAYETADALPFSGDGFTWRRVSDLTYPDNSIAVRYVLSHKSVYDAFCRHGHYYFGKKDGAVALAIPCDADSEPHPLPVLGELAVYVPPYFIICADTVKKVFFPYKKG